MPDSEKIGRHKGAVETLLHEQKELSRILQIVQGQLERHLSALEEAGVDTDTFIQEFQENVQRQQERQKQVQERTSGEKNASASVDDEDVEDFFEEDDDLGDRDFNPNA